MVIHYCSTRGKAPELTFGDALLTGLASDGGLYCPVELPSDPTVASEQSYADAALAVIAPFVEGTFSSEELAPMIEASYASFRHPSVCPVINLQPGHYLVDLAQGPTLAFKDVALQLVGRMLEAELAKRGDRLTILAATSGDTGSAAIEAVANKANIEIVVLHPLDRVSDVQRRQMTTVAASNVHNIAIRGSFDDCQDLVKAAFADESLRNEVRLGAVNSINWARVMAQVVYYFTSARAVNPGGEPVSFVVPTGNFGNVLAGWYAKKMGLAVDRLIVASNRNDVLTRFFETGLLKTARVEPSLSPSMDIQISSNFERLLWEASGRQGDQVAQLLSALRSDGEVEVPQAWQEAIRAEFDFYRFDDGSTSNQIAQTLSASDQLVDPHTAVGIGAAHQAATAFPGRTAPLITLATADPAKFPDAVEAACQIRPELPPHLSELFDRHEHFDVMDGDLSAIATKLRSVGQGG